jgi:LmbE family N-acetylglucosaminyl deacetylase
MRELPPAVLDHLVDVHVPAPPHGYVLTFVEGEQRGVAAPGANRVAPAEPQHGATTVIDVRAQVERKVAAIAAHRSQYPFEPGMFPAEMLRDMFGKEYFVRVLPPPEPETDLLAD